MPNHGKYCLREIIEHAGSFIIYSPRVLILRNEVRKDLMRSFLALLVRMMGRGNSPTHQIIPIDPCCLLRGRQGFVFFIIL